MKPAILIRELPVEAGVFHASVRVAEVFTGPGCDPGGDSPSEPFLHVVRTYRNDPEQVPGRPVWLCLNAQSGQWVAESEVSLQDAVERAIS